MTFRLLASSAVFAFVALAAPAAGQDTGGGALAPATAPSAEAAQDETPTTPEGEQQPPEEQPDGEQAPTEDDGELEGEDGQGGSGGDEAVEESAGELPRTGFPLAAMTAIGLGLLLAGAALFPTSSWPPPRSRLSRSTQRRQPAPRPRTRR